MGVMLTPLFVVAVASVFAPDGGVRAPRAGADITSRLSQGDVCRLAVMAARKEIPAHHTSLLTQPAASELAGEHGRIWMDVRVSEHGRSRYPLARGESCGDQELVELCDWERLGNRCSRDRKERERWRVDVVLTVVDDDHVDSMAFLEKPPRVRRHWTAATMSPVPAFYAHFERGDGGWHEGADVMTERH